MSIQQLTQHCPHCGQELRTAARFCDACGQPLSTVSLGTPAAIAQPSPLEKGQRATVDTPSPGGVGWRLPQQSAATPTPRPMKPPSSTGQPLAQPQPTTRVQRGIVGEARGIQQRTEQDPDDSGWTWNIWTFRVERYDTVGNRQQPVAVEMRSRFFEGAINEGDWVEVPGVWQGSGMLRPPYVFNITTGSVVKAKTNSHGLPIVAGILILAIFWTIGLIPLIQYLSDPFERSGMPLLFPIAFLLFPVAVTVGLISYFVRRRRDNDHA